jgi:hypothetical protein
MLLLFILLACVTDDDDPPVDTGPDCFEEICDGLDNDCDGEIDEDASDMVLWYLDEDSDGYGDEPITACDQPSGTVTVAGDCDDNAPQVNPSAPELCNGIDDNCDEVVDLDAEDLQVFYQDSDGDGYGDAALTSEGCEAPSGYVERSDDCNDREAAIHPDAVEECNLQDDNCDGTVDEGFEQADYYRDWDGDGAGNPDAVVQACMQPSGYVSDGTDCDDYDDTIYPASVEWCDDQDNDCDGEVDEDPVDAVAGFLDADGDGFGGAASAFGCEGDGVSLSDADCDDGDSEIHPDARERCRDGVDNNCDEVVDFCEMDISDAFFLGSLEIGSPVEYCSPLATADYDGDGVTDVVCGHSNANNVLGSDGAYGAAYVVSGAAWSASAPVTATTAYWEGDAEGDQAGGAIGTLPDLEGDGAHEILISSPYADLSDREGVVYLVYSRMGSSSGSLGSASSAEFWGSEELDRVGYALTTGDVDGDGDEDIFIAAPGAGSSGTIYGLSGGRTYSGTYDLESDADDTWASFGSSTLGAQRVDAGGDVNGDGLADLLSAAENYDCTDDEGQDVDDCGMTVLVPGDSSGGLFGTVWRIFGDEEDSNLGYELAHAGDVDGDGYGDLLISSASDTVVYLVKGTEMSEDWVQISDVAATGFSSNDADIDTVRPHAAGDLNQDGQDDVALGSLLDDSTAYNGGAVYLFHGDIIEDGVQVLEDAPIIWYGDSALMYLGADVEALGDCDGDGFPDLLVGSWEGAWVLSGDL